MNWTAPLETLAFHLARRRLAGPPAHQKTREAVNDWRDGALPAQYREFFSDDALVGQRVVDFGCGSGGLSFYAASVGAASVIGIDMEEPIRARDEARRRGLKVQFIRGERTTVPLPSNSADVVLCFDVMEHVAAYEAIIHEWARILVPGGRVLMWWSLWMHPYGHHCHNEITLPWLHLILPEQGFMRVGARLYDDPRHRPAHWQIDRQGQRKPNPYVTDPTFGEYLNRLTTWRFERICRAAGFLIALRRVPFSGRFQPVKRLLAKIPYANDAFCGCAVYELRRK
jgi:SAM-dependent methyltransferase